jgi:AAA15 family ATPase/GTPase
MIHSFSCKNFYSFLDEMEVSFVVDNNAPKNDSYVDNAAETRLSLVETVAGPNASGKTNILKVIPFLQYLIVWSYTRDPDHKIPVEAFKKTIEGSEPTCLSVTFSIPKTERIFTYSFELTAERILKEELSERSKSSERFTTKVLFSRTWDEAAGTYVIKDKVFGATEKSVRTNASIVSDAFRANNELATTIARYWRDEVATNVGEDGYEGDHPLARHHIAEHAINFFYENPDVRNKASDLLRRFDIGFDDFARHEANGKMLYNLHHAFGVNDFELPLAYESSGTKQLIVVLRYALTALLSGGVAVIDELDAYLHPDIVEEIVSMFVSKEINTKHAQLLFSSHSHRLLAKLDKYQIILAEKNGKGGTEVWRLDDVKGIRPDENYYTKYIAGAYGALPNLG